MVIIWLATEFLLFATFTSDFFFKSEAPATYEYFHRDVYTLW